MKAAPEPYSILHMVAMGMAVAMGTAVAMDMGAAEGMVVQAVGIVLRGKS